MLEYCSYGTYPGPKNGYPGFWWFEYGIRDVGAALKSLEDRGYIVFASVKKSVNSFTVAQLKDLLSSKGLSNSGKKSDLVMRVTNTFSEAELLANGVQPKYMLTELGNCELSENEYVPYMHKTNNKNTEDSSFGMIFNVWSINKLLGADDKSNCKNIVDEQEKKLLKQNAEKHTRFMENLKKEGPKLYNEWKTEDQKFAELQAARMKYEESNDIDTYILFWERLWENGGLTFLGSRWQFELADLYIIVKRYYDAL